MPAAPNQPNGGDPTQAREAINEVTLDHFTAEPTTIAPFTGSKLSWKVSVPKNFDAVDGMILLDDNEVWDEGNAIVAPDHTRVYRLTARAGRYSKHLGEDTVEVDRDRCDARSDSNVPFVLGSLLRSKITMDSSLSLREPPKVSITPDRLNVALRLTKKIDYIPDPDVDIDISFGLGLVQESGSTITHVNEAIPLYATHHLVATNTSINTSVSFPAWFTLLEGVVVYIATVEGNNDAHASAEDIVAEFVAGLDTWFSEPSTMDKHDVTLWVDDQQTGWLTVTFCPIPRPTNTLLGSAT